MGFKKVAFLFLFELMFEISNLILPVPMHIKPPSLSPHTIDSRKMIGYYTNWAQYRPTEGKFLPLDIDYFLYTHIVYSFLTIDVEFLELPDSKATYGFSLKLTEPNDISHFPIGYLIDVINNAHQIGVKVIISIGGKEFNQRSGMSYWIWTTLCSEVKYRSQIITDIIHFVTKYGIDGVDIAWMWPNDHLTNQNLDGTFNDDRDPLRCFLTELRNSLNKLENQELANSLADSGEDLTISLMVSHDESKISDYYPEWSKINEVVDWIGVAAYDYHGSWENTTDSHTPMEADHENRYSIKKTIQGYLDFGVPCEKIILGIATYGQGWSNVNEAKLGTMGYLPSPKGIYTRKNGIYSYYEIEQLVQDFGFYKYWDGLSQTPFIYSPDKKILITYEDTESLQKKINYVIENFLGGTFIWPIDMDNFQAGNDLQVTLVANLM
jgi:chitinase